MTSELLQERNFRPAVMLLSSLMKITTLVMTALLAVSIQVATPVSAQDTKSPGKEWRRSETRWGNLSGEEREKMKAAHNKAMLDPSVAAAKQKLRQARNEFRDVMHAAMLKADPSIQPILQKLPKEKGEEKSED
jgi:membrane-bound lytic murein transglycosylase B